MTDTKKPIDIWRDSPLRFVGYCNEVGEAFAPIYPRFLLPSYILSVGYVLGDTCDKTLIAYNEENSNSKTIDYRSIAIKAGDVLCWQMLASVIAPGLTIKAVAKVSTQLFNTSFATRNLSQSVCKYSPTALGLFAIPFIIKPIDHAVDEFMDSYYRSNFKKYYSSRVEGR